MTEPKKEIRDNQFARALRMGLADTGISQRQLAMRQGIRGHDTIGRYARGERIPSRQRQWELLLALDLPSFYQVEPRKVSRRTPVPTDAVPSAKQTPRERLAAMIPAMSDDGIAALMTAMRFMKMVPEFWGNNETKQDTKH